MQCYGIWINYLLRKNGRRRHVLLALKFNAASRTCHHKHNKTFTNTYVHYEDNRITTQKNLNYNSRRWK